MIYTQMACVWAVQVEGVVVKLMATPFEQSKGGEVHDATNESAPATDGHGAAAPVQVSFRDASSRG